MPKRHHRTKKKEEDITAEKYTPEANDKADSKIIIALFILVLITGIYFRVHDYGLEGGLSQDTSMVIAGGVMWFYPHDFFPGLLMMYPPVSHQIVGAGCMLSGADFSGSTQLKPNFLVNIAALLGKGFAEAENYCILPSYIASILLFIGLIALGLSILDRRSALYHAAFYAFFPMFIWWGRTIFVEIYVWMFAVYGILFLWLSYRTGKGAKKEKIYSMISFGFIGLAFATKFTAAMYFPFALFIITEKYRTTLANKIKMFFGAKTKKTTDINKIEDKINQINQDFISYGKLAIYSIISFAFFALLPFQFSLKNLIDVYTMFNQWFGGLTGIKISTNGLNYLYDIMYHINTIDIIVFLLSFYILFQLIQKNNKTQNEKYITYLYLLAVFTTSISGALSGQLERRTMLFFFGIPLMMSLLFSNETYSIINNLRSRGISNKSINIGFISLIILYVIHGYSILQPITPFDLSYSNPVMCKINNEPVCTPQYSPSWKTIATQLKTILKEDETYYDYNGGYVNMYMYLRHEDGYIIWQIEESFKYQTKRDMTLKELKHYFNYNGRKLRYLVIQRLENNKAEIEDIVKNYPPDHIARIKDHPVGYIYDLNKIYPELNETQSQTTQP